jgi:predicted HD phosphohydrolase
MKLHRVVNLLHKQYNKYGGVNYCINEPVSILSHSTQSAIWVINNIPSRNHGLVVASLLHDYGHIAHGVPISPDTGVDDRHEIIGADALTSLGFGPEVTEPIRLHVMAKRYLCTTNPHYTLSEGSKLSLVLQGGLMSDRELSEFRKNIYWEDAIILRYADDYGKDETEIESGACILNFEDYIMNVLQK